MNANTFAKLALSAAATVALSASAAVAGPNYIRWGEGAINANRYPSAAATRYTPAPRSVTAPTVRWFAPAPAANVAPAAVFVSHEAVGGAASTAPAPVVPAPAGRCIPTR
jgi:hypothetical protein